MTSRVVFDELLSRTAAFAKRRGVSLYLVGGFLRDTLLRRSVAAFNLDFAVQTRALELAQALARHLRGSYVCLDEATSTGRVVMTEGEARIELDVANFRGRTIEEDLARRDFTINALALPLDRWTPDPAQWTGQLLDPTGGWQDLSRARLRACFPGAFTDDPLRILRAFRFAAELNLELDPALPEQIAPAVSRLSDVSGERVRDELFAVFRTTRAHWAIRQLNALGVVDVIFPEIAVGRGIDQGDYHHLDVLSHELETVAQCDRMLAGFEEFSEPLRAPLADYCRRMPVDRRPMGALIKLAGLHHDVGKPATRRVKPDGDVWFIGHEHFGSTLVESLIERLRLSNQEGRTLTLLVEHHLRPGFLSREPQLTRRAVFRFFRDLGDDGPACLLLWWADRLATRGPLSNTAQIPDQRARLEELLRAYFFKPEEAIRPPKLIDGHELMQALGVPPGPLVGQLLRAIEETQAEGKLRSKDEAVALAQLLLAAKKTDP